MFLPDYIESYMLTPAVRAGFRRARGLSDESENRPLIQIQGDSLPL